jgi:hypothetical protein
MCKCPDSATIKTCGGRCVNVNQDHENCGMCGKSCAGFEVCNGGTCVGTSPLDAGTNG